MKMVAYECWNTQQFDNGKREKITEGDCKKRRKITQEGGTKGNNVLRTMQVALNISTMVVSATIFALDWSAALYSWTLQSSVTLSVCLRGFNRLIQTKSVACCVVYWYTTVVYSELILRNALRTSNFFCSLRTWCSFRQINDQGLGT